MSGVGWAERARRRPSGAYEKPVTWKVPRVSWVALRSARLSTHSRFQGYIWAGVQASSLSFSFFLRSSLLGSRARNARVVPCGDQSKSETLAGASDSRVASPPSGRITQIWRLASSVSPSGFRPGRGRSERNAIRLPSGDQRG